MTRKLLWDEPYRTELDTRVASSAGQESDRGTIGGHEVPEARKDDLCIAYTLAAGRASRRSAPTSPKTIVDRDQPIVTGFSDVTAERRYWELDAPARVSCGGTHCHRTSEIGPVELRRDNNGRGKERIVIRLA